MKIKTKTKKIKDLNEKECQYICNQQEYVTCDNCPLHISRNGTNKLNGCYYVLKAMLDTKGEETITL